MISFREFLEEANTPRKKKIKKYPYKLNKRKAGQKHRTIASSNSSFEAQKELSMHITAAKKRLKFKKRKNHK